MYNINLSLLFVLILTSGYKYPFVLRKAHTRRFLSNDSNENTNKVPINLDVREIIAEMDRLKIASLDKIPQPPQSEDEIEEDSFEGYLREQFESIDKIDSDYVNFEEFYAWRKKIGTVLTKDEAYEFYTLMAGENEECDLMNFICINRLIDENDGAFYE